jgi:hypothetical protein
MKPDLAGQPQSKPVSVASFLKEIPLAFMAWRIPRLSHHVVDGEQRTAYHERQKWRKPCINRTNLKSWFLAVELVASSWLGTWRKPDGELPS